jgi:5'-deoxynucleotidase YfbR-like HD superfamily hydrolase
VEEICATLDGALGPADRLTALLHDAAEYVIGDMISPFKTALGVDYKAFERRLEGAVHVRFGLPASPQARLARLIKQADKISAYFEATQLAGFTPGEAERFFGRPPAALTLALEPWPAQTAQDAFLARFSALIDGLD